MAEQEKHKVCGVEVADPDEMRKNDPMKNFFRSGLLAMGMAFVALLCSLLLLRSGEKFNGVLLGIIGALFVVSAAFLRVMWCNVTRK